MAIERIDSDLLTSDGEFCDTRYNASAFTVAELGVMLPRMLGRGTKATFFEVDHSEENLYFAHFCDKWFKAKTEAEARADLLIYLIEAKKITAAECNERLRNA